MPSLLPRLTSLACLLYGTSAPLSAQITVGVSQIPESLHPYSVQANPEVLNFYHRPLIRATSKYRWDCVLCESAPTFENNQAKVEKRGKTPFLLTHWRIRKDARWDDGKPVTAKDVLFTWQILKGLADAKLFNHPMLYEVDDIKAGTDPLAFDMTFIGLSADYLRLPGFYLIPQHLEQKTWDACLGKTSCYFEQTLYRTLPSTKGLYNGPFIPAGGRTPTQLALARNGNYKISPAKLKTLTLKTVNQVSDLNDQLASYDLVLPGVMDTLEALALEKKVGTSEQKKDYRFFYTESDRLELLVFNARNPVFADLKVREAIAFGLDRKELLNKVFLGAARLVQNIFDQPWWPKDESLAAPGFSPEKAQKILETDGWDLKENQVRKKEQQTLQMMITLVAGDRTRAAVAENIKMQLSKIGIATTIQEVGRNDFTKSILVKAEFRDAVLVAWDLNQGLLPKSILHSKEVPNFSNQYYGQNIGGWRSSEADELLEKLETAFDPKEKQTLVASLTERLYKEVPHIPLYFVLAPSLQKKTVQGFVPTSFSEPAAGYAELWQANQL